MWHTYLEYVPQNLLREKLLYKLWSASHQVTQHKDPLESHQVCWIEQITQYEENLCSWGIFRGKLAIRTVSKHNITQRNQDLIKGRVRIRAIAMQRDPRIPQASRDNPRGRLISMKRKTIAPPKISPSSTGSSWPGTGSPASGRAGTGRSRSVGSRSTSQAC